MDEDELEQESEYGQDFEDIVASGLEEEIQKGSASELPRDYLAMTSVMNDFATKGGNLTRDDITQAIGDQSNEIAQRKADIYKRISTNANLSNSQLVALGVLALGLVAAGGAARGKRGLAAAGDAIKLGGGVFLGQEKQSRDADKAAAVAELKALSSQENELTKLGFKNAMAPVEREERIGEYVEKKKRAKAAGVGGSELAEAVKGLAGLFPNNISMGATDKIANVDGIIANALPLVEQLKALPSETVWDTGKWQVSKQFSATDAGKLNASVKLLARQMIMATDRGAPSDFDTKSWEQILQGDWTGSPSDMAALVGQSTAILARSAAAQGRAQFGLRTDPEKVLTRYESVAKQLLGDATAKPGDELINLSMSKPGVKAPAGAGRGKLVTLKDGTTKVIHSKDELKKLQAEGLY